MKRINEFFIKQSNFKKLIGLLIITIVYKIFVIDKMIANFAKLTNGAKLLDFYAGLKSNQAYEIISTYGDEAVKYYNVIQLADIILPLLMGLTYVMGISLLIKKVYNGKKYKSLSTIPLFTVTLFDYIENIGIAVMLRKFPGSLSGIAVITGFFTTLKMASYGLSIFIILVLLIKWIIKRLRK